MIKFKFMEATVESFHVALKANEVTSEELTKWYLNRIEAYDRQGPTLQSVVTVNPRAMEEAKELDDYYVKTGKFKGSLHGVPVLLKDQAETAELRTTFGTKAFGEYIPKNDATVVKLFRQAGAVILAKTTMCDLAAGWFSASSLTDHSKNPYDLKRDTGGSSAGTGGAVAANFGLIGLGEDTGGSIRIPSSFNNLFGLRPTTGLISRNGFSPLLRHQDTPGPMCRTVRDCAKMMDVLVGFDSMDEFTAAVVCTQNAGEYEALLVGADIKEYRIGVLENAFGSCEDSYCSPVNSVIRSTIEQLKEKGVTVVEGLEIDGLSEWINDTSLYTLQSKREINDFFQKRLESGVSGYRKDIYRANAFHELNDLFHDMDAGPESPEDSLQYYRKRVRQEELRRTILNLMKSNEVDFLVYPNVQVLPPTFEDLYAWKWTCLTFPTNTVIASQSILPAMSIPAGFSGHLPVGMEIVGRPYMEAELLRFAYAYEQHFSPRKTPDSCPEVE